MYCCKKDDNRTQIILSCILGKTWFFLTVITVYSLQRTLIICKTVMLSCCRD